MDEGSVFIVYGSGEECHIHKPIGSSPI